MADIKVSVKNNRLIIDMPLEKPHPSRSGKTLTVASTYGNIKTGVKVSGKEVTVGVNAYIPVG